MVMDELGVGGSDLADPFDHKYTHFSPSCIMKLPCTFLYRTGVSNTALCECMSAISGGNGVVL